MTVEAAEPAVTVRGPGRCLNCSFHVGTQGHREGCGGSSGDAANAAYREGKCVACRVERYSAGRPRCAACHAVSEGRTQPVKWWAK
jgi:hypothetical protein